MMFAAQGDMPEWGGILLGWLFIIGSIIYLIWGND
jgi:hypothetical protein